VAEVVVVVVAVASTVAAVEVEAAVAAVPITGVVEAATVARLLAAAAAVPVAAMGAAVRSAAIPVGMATGQAAAALPDITATSGLAQRSPPGTAQRARRRGGVAVILPLLEPLSRPDRTRSRPEGQATVT
jgi:hypothetical protein